VYVLVLEAFPEPFDKEVVRPTATAVQAESVCPCRIIAVALSTLQQRSDSSNGEIIKAEDFRSGYYAGSDPKELGKGPLPRLSDRLGSRNHRAGIHIHIKLIRTPFYRGGSVWGLFFRVKGYFASKNGGQWIVIRLGKKEGVAAVLLRN
jgi:hypothetical protein